MKPFKINDLSNSPLRKRFQPTVFVPANNNAVKWRRVSTTGQKKKGHFSDEAQDENIEEYVEKESLNVVRSWDCAETASRHDKRRNFHEMVDFIEESQDTNTPIKHVIFSYTSRSSRNRQSRQELERLLDLGIVIHFARDNLKLTCQSDLAEKMHWLFKSYKDEEDIEIHRRNVWEGMVKRVEMGLFPGKAPYGYKNFRPGDDELSIFIFNPGPDAYMKKAFESFSSGIYSEVQLHAELEVSFAHLPKRPSAKRLSELLRNPFYYGSFDFMGTIYPGNPEYHPPLISFDVWKRVQEVLAGRYRKRVTERDHPYLGMMKCGGYLLNSVGEETDLACGSAVTAEEQRKKLKSGDVNKHIYYHCARNKPDGQCSQRDTGFMQTVGRRVNYTEAEIELLFEAVFRPLSFTPEVCTWMQDVLRKEHAEKSGDHKQQVAALRRQCEMIQGYVDASYMDKLRGDLTQDEWREKNQRWKQQLAEAKAKIDLLDEGKQDYIEKGVLLIELAQRTEHIYKNATPEVKRKLVEIVSSNHVLRNGTIEFDYRKPFDVLAKSTPKEKWWT